MSDTREESVVVLRARHDALRDLLDRNGELLELLASLGIHTKTYQHAPVFTVEEAEQAASDVPEQFNELYIMAGIGLVKPLREAQL